MNNKKTILIFIDWFLPGTNAGGPVRSVYSMIKYLQQDYHFRIFTRNTDHQSTKEYETIESDKWIKFDDDVEIYYCSQKKLNKAKLEYIISEQNYYKIYINSLYSSWFSIYPLQITHKKGLNSKVILAPRGMLGKGALAIKPFKKKLFLTLAKLKGLHQNITWQASSNLEEKDIVKVFGSKAKIKIAGNLSYIAQVPFTKRIKQEKSIHLFFLSRIVPIKNLHTALKAIQQIPDIYQIKFDIYGPIEDQEYWKQCEAIIQFMPTSKKIAYKGILNNETVQQQLQNYHALCMPTLNENFGHSILESFAAGCLAIISDQTPWNNLDQLNIGYNLAVHQPNAINELANEIQRIADLPEEKINDFGLKAWSFAHFYLMNNTAILANKKLFE